MSTLLDSFLDNSFLEEPGTLVLSHGPRLTHKSDVAKVPDFIMLFPCFSLMLPLDKGFLYS